MRSFHLPHAARHLSALACLLATLGAQAAPPSTASLDRLYTVTKTAQLSEQMTQRVSAMLKPMFDQQLNAQGLSAEKREEASAGFDTFVQRVTPVFAEELAWARMKPLYDEVYTSTFSQEEVDGLISFYESPVGRSFVDKMPLVMERTMGLVGQRMGPMMQKIAGLAQQMAAEMKAKQDAAAAAKK